MSIPETRSKNQLFKLILGFILAGSIALFVPKIALAGNILYADAAVGTDMGPCNDVDNPCQTLNYALSKVVSESGDTIYASGTFSEQVALLPEHNGTWNSPTTITSWGNIDSEYSDPVIDASNWSAGFFVNEANYISITDFEVKNSADHGIYFLNTTGCSAYNNTVHHNTNSGIMAYGSDLVTVLKNVVYDNSYGVSTNSSIQMTIGNNFIYSNSIYGISLIGDTDGAEVINNTLYKNSTIDLVVGYPDYGSATNTALLNNIIYTNTYGINVGDSESASTLVSDHNNIYPIDSGRVGYWQGEDQDTLTDWRAISSADSDSISADPVFSSITEGSEDLHLLGNSPCIDAGIDVSEYEILDDINGDDRPYLTSLVDIGADETQFPGRVSNLAASNVLADSVTVSWTASSYGDPDFYTLSYGTDEAASNIGAINTTTNSKDLTSLTPNTTYYLKVRATGANGESGYSDILSFSTLPTSIGVIVTPHSNGGPLVRIYDGDGQLKNWFYAFSKQARGEFHAMTADTDGNPQTREIVAWPGSGFGPHLRVFSEEGDLITQNFAFAETGMVGLNITAGDLDGDGKDEILALPANNAGPQLRVYKHITSNNSLLLSDSTFVYDSSLSIKVNFATGDLDGDGKDEVVTVPAADQPAHLRVFKKTGDDPLQLLADTFVYDTNFNKGANITVGDLDGDGQDEIAVAPAQQGGPDIKIYQLDSNNTLSLVTQIMAYSSAVRAGFNLAVGDLDGDAAEELIIAPATSGVAPEIKAYRLENNELSLVTYFQAYDQEMQAGVNIVTCDIDNDNDEDLIVAPKAYAPNTRIYKNQAGTLTLKNWFWAFQKTFTGGVNLGK